MKDRWWPDGGWHVVGAVIGFFVVCCVVAFYAYRRHRHGQ
jgi:hypothetical protein